MNKDNRKTALFIASFLLRYPDEKWHEDLEEVKEELEKMKNEAYVKPILNFLEYTKQSDKLGLSESYVNTFDFTKKTPLYLTYYTFKEQKQRGMALLKLKQRYAEAGLLLADTELPDFLPVMLEFASAASAEEIFKDYINVIQGICDNLIKDNNPYSHVFDAILLIIKAFDNEYIQIGNHLKGGALK